MDNILTTIKERVLYIAELKGIAKSVFFEEIGMSYSNFKGKNKKTPLNSDTIVDILSKYPDINPSWLLQGKGEILTSTSCKVPDKSIQCKQKKVPFWNLPVSAGKSVNEITGATKPDGFLTGLPGLDVAEHVLPVIGNSMEPEIPNGAIVGIKSLSNFESLNTERIYLIITREDRMIKRIEQDPNNPEILWCISPNYPKFSIPKSEIIEMHVVCFVYESR